MQKSLEFCMRWMGYAEILTRARARKGEAQGVLTYQKVTGIFDNPHIYMQISTYSWMIDFTLQKSLLIQSKMNLIHQGSSIKYVWNSNFMFFIITSCFSINGCFEMRLSPCLRYVGAPSEDGSVCARASSTRAHGVCLISRWVFATFIPGRIRGTWKTAIVIEWCMGRHLSLQ